MAKKTVSDKIMESGRAGKESKSSEYRYSVGAHRDYETKSLKEERDYLRKVKDQSNPKPRQRSIKRINSIKSRIKALEGRADNEHQ